jgi:uncharacterized phage protein (TIGR02218 family)
MPQLTASLTATVRSNEAQLCRLYWIRRQDGVEYNLTDWPISLTVTTPEQPTIPHTGPNQTLTRRYTPIQSPLASALTTDISGVASTASFSSYLTIDGIDLADIRMGRFEDSEVYIFLMDPTKPDSATVISIGYLAGAIDRGGEKFEVSYFSLEQRLETEIGATVTERCPYKLGDFRCTLNAKSALCTVIALGLNPRNSVTVDLSAPLAGSNVPNFWAFGGAEIMITVGRMEGLRGEILKSEYLGGRQHTLFLLNELPEPFRLGDELRLIEGCENTVTACSDRGNIVNYGGFPDLPGIDRLLTSA